MKPTTALLNRDEHVTRTIFPARRTELKLPELRRTLAPRLARVIRATCLWDDSFELGDYRFAVFSIDVAPKIHVFAQLWSEPLEPVLLEVSSGAWDPPTGEWLSGERSRRVEAFGFQVGGNAENYGREVEVRTPADASRIARTIVNIFYAAFDYRGLQPVKADLAWESRAERRLAYDAFTPEDVRKLLAKCGYHVELVDDDEDAPVMHAVRRGILTKVTFFDRVEDQRLFGRAVLASEIEVPPDSVAAVCNGIVSTAGDEPNRARLWTTLLFDGGVTVGWLARRLRDWDRVTWSCRKEARRRKSASPPAADGTIH